VPLEKRFDVLRRDQTHVVAQERSTGGRCNGNKIRPVTTKEKIVVGDRVPADVELEAVPADWGPSLTKYRYVYSGDRVILVDPDSRTDVQEVD
jgi:Protein of unknown function (DUF1236)